MFQVGNQIFWKLIPIDVPARVLSRQPTNWQKFDTCINIPVIENKFLADPRLNSPLRVPKPPVISIPLFTPGWEEIEPEEPRIHRDPRKRKKEIKNLSLQATTQKPTPPPPPNLLSYEDLPSTSCNKPSLFLKPIEQLLATPENNNLEGGGINPENNNLEEGEIPTSPVHSEYWEPDLEIDLNSPVKLEVEPDIIQLDEIGSSESNTQTSPVFGRDRPPESVLTFSDFCRTPSPLKIGCSATPSPLDLTSKTPSSFGCSSAPSPLDLTSETRFIKINPRIEVPIPDRFKEVNVEIKEPTPYRWICNCQNKPSICSICHNATVTFNLKIVLKCRESRFPARFSTPLPAEKLWEPDVEQHLQDAIELFPECGRRKFQSFEHGRKLGRNEMISEYIKSKTGKVRTHKQVSSRIQAYKSRKTM